MIAQMESAASGWAGAGVFAVVLVVAFWLLKRSDDREAKAADTARTELAALHAEHARGLGHRQARQPVVLFGPADTGSRHENSALDNP